MTAFDQLFHETAMPVLQEQFGESVTYYPKQGTPKRITVIIGRSVITRPDQMIVGDDRDLLDVTVQEQDISSPVRGDKIQRVEFGDPRTKLYVHTGKVITEAPWVLEFERLYV